MDLEEDLEVVRSWERIREPKPGTFYLQGKGFLHFHSDKGGNRWADVRDGADWGPRIDIPPGCPAKVRRQFLNRLRECYDATLAALAR